DAKLEKVRALGADETVNTAREDLVKRVKELTDKRGADVVFEHVGKAVFPQVILACARGGRIVTCGSTTGFDPAIDLRHIFFRQISLIGSTMGSKGDMYDIVRHVAAGRLKPVVDRILPLSQARDAHMLLEDRAVFGKLVLQVNASAT